MERLPIGVAGGHVMVLAGLKSWVQAQPSLELTFEAAAPAHIPENQDGVLIIDFASTGFSPGDIQQIKAKNPRLKLLGILSHPVKELILGGIDSGLKNFILTECDSEEILDALHACWGGLDFMCGKIAASIGVHQHDSATCEGSLLTQRELDIVRLIAEGHSNKLIADRLFLSPHTVNTHRKNIMAKLSVNNTAGLVMYAVRENILNPNKFLFS